MPSVAVHLPLALAWVPASGSEWLAVGLAYLLGAVPFGYVLGRLRGVDIRRSGSGNIGATNAGRVLGRPFAYLAFVGDFGKGWVPGSLFAPWLAAAPERVPDLEVLCAVAAVAGHVWPVYLRFHGGKAVATTAGALTAIDPLVFLAGGAVWCLVALLTRWVGLSSIAMTLTFPIVLAWKEPERHTAIGATALIALLILIRHRANIARMLNGTEPKMGSRRSQT